jgi:pilus assembly protein CpaF
MATVPLKSSGPPITSQLEPFQAIHPQPPSQSARAATQAASNDPEPTRGLHLQLLEEISPEQVEGLGEQDLRLHLRRLAEERAQDDPLSLDHKELEDAINLAVDEILGYGPIAGLLRENDITEILINGPRQVFIERRGQLLKSEATFRDSEHLLLIVQRMIAATGRRLDKYSPMVDARLPDGSRLNAVLNPPALNGPLIAIRRFGVRPLMAEDLLAKESLTAEMLDFLAACVKGRINILVSGGTGSGKTTLLNALSRFIPSSERIVTIEDTAELDLQQPHVAKLEGQPADLEGKGAITMRDLVRNSLRMRPDRIIVGECRGGEAFDMLQAMSTGHEGSMTTIHASNPREAIMRLELIVGLAGLDIPAMALRKLIASSIRLIVQVSRQTGGKRRVTSITEITGMEGDATSMHPIFSFVQTGTDAVLGAEGYFTATGIRPQLLHTLKARGAELPNELFIERRLQLPSGRGSAR